MEKPSGLYLRLDSYGYTVFKTSEWGDESPIASAYKLEEALEQARIFLGRPIELSLQVK